MLNVVAHASSRGAFIAMLAAGLATFVVARGKLRKRAFVGLLLGGVAAGMLFHQQFWNRMATIDEYEEDGSAMGRIEAWNAAMTLTERNPFGYGAEAFDRGLATPLMPNGFHTTHNMFFEVLVAWGVQGGFFFFGFIFLTARDCWKLRRQLWQPGLWPPSREYLDTLGLLAGLVGMLVAAVFLNRMRWELWWVFAAYVVCLKNIYISSLARPGGFSGSSTDVPVAPDDAPRHHPAEPVF